MNLLEWDTVTPFFLNGRYSCINQVLMICCNGSKLDECK